MVYSASSVIGMGTLTARDLGKTSEIFKSLLGFPEAGSPAADGPLPSFSSNSSFADQVWHDHDVIRLFQVNLGKGFIFWKDVVE